MATGQDAGGGGGGGGAHGLVGIVPIAGVSWNTGSIAGGAGGAGGNSQTGGGPFIFSDGGSGGAGGYGIVASGNSYNPAPSTGGTITGGAGGAGGIGNYTGGAGGSGGVGLYFAESTNVGMVISQAITGGAGGAGGASFGYPSTRTGAPGAGGAGIVGNNLSLTLASTVSGGLSGDGATRANAITFTGGANALTFNTGSWQLIGGIDVTGSLSIDAPFNDEIANVISGSGSLIKQSRFLTSYIILSGTNTYTGETVIEKGALRIQSASALGSTAAGTVVNSGGALELHHVSGQFLAIGREALTLNGTGFAGGGALRSITGTTVYEGAITLASASLIKADAGSLTLDGAISLAGHDLTLGGAGSINVNYLIGGTGAVTVDGATATFREQNFYSGRTTLNSGQLNVEGVGRLGQNANPLTVNGGTLTFYGNAANPPNTLSNYIVGSLSGTGGTITGLVATSQALGQVKILTVDGSSTTTYAGNLSGNLRAEFQGGGTTTLTGAVSVTDAVIVTGTGTRVNFGTATGGVLNQKITSQIAVGAGATIAFSNDDTASISHQISGGGSLIKLGTGLLTLNNLQGFTGAINVDSGTLELGSGVTLASSTVVTVLTGARFIYGNQLQLTQLSGSSLGTDNIAVVSNAGETFSGDIAGAGRTLTKNGAGTLTLSGVQSFTGLITVSGGTLELTNPNNTLRGGIVVNGRLVIGATGATGGASNTITTTGSVIAIGDGVTNASPVSINSNSTQFEVAGTGASAVQSGVISEMGGSRGFEKIGDGSLTLAATNTYSGVTTISAGTLVAGSSTTGATPTAALGDDSATNIVRLNGGRLRIDSQAASFSRPVEITALNGTISNDAALTLNGATTFTGTLTKTGGGSLILNGVGTGAGGVTVSGGVLQIGNSAALGTGTLRFNAKSGTLIAGATTLSIANPIVLERPVSIDTLGNTLTLAGAISGAGGITKTGSGTLNLAGANGFTGTVTHNGGRLGIGSDSALGTSRTSVASGATIVALADVRLANAIELGPRAGTFTASPIFDTNGKTMTIDGVISAVVPGFSEQIVSGLTKTGAGTLVLNGVNTYAGPTTVNAGTLVVNGSIAASSGITIAQGATLGGNGGTPSLTVQGTISPGNSVGVLNVNGGLVLASTATTVIEMEGAAADRINVTGNAALNGALQLVAAGGTYAFATPYTILTATGARTGTFASVSTVGSFGVGVASAVSYGAQNVQVTLTAAPLVTPPPAPAPPPASPPGSPPPAPAATTTSTTTEAGPTPVAATPAQAQQTPVLGFSQTRNITAVASALDRAAFSGVNLSSLFNIYNQPTREALAAAVNTLSGEVHTATTAMGLRASDQFLRVMLDPFAIGRDGSMTGTSGFSGFTADLPSRKGPVAAPAFVRIEPSFSVWGASFGQIDRTRGDSGVGSATREIKDANIAVGADYRIAPGAVIGFALSGGQSRAELGRNLGKADADIFQIGLYGATRLGALNLAASLSYAAMQVETRRSLPALGVGVAADYNAHVWGGRLQAAYDLFSAGGFTVSPIAALQVQSVHTPNFRETNSATGAGAGVVGRSHTNTALRSDLGLRLTSQTALGGRKVTLFTEIAWAHAFQRDMAFAASLAGVANTNFVVEGARANRDAALFSAGADMRLTPNLTLGGRFDASLSGNSRSYAGTGALRASF